MITPVLMGTVVGFMLLADKEDGTWRAVAVTPVSLRGYLVWRAGLAVGLAGPLALLGLRVGGLNDLAGVRARAWLWPERPWRVLPPWRWPHSQTRRFKG
ncbi:hypothetical protein [Actinomyces ruminis]|uniref:Uncharacterized protein n=1 Tax=Actinomyces ruminis TaxID=1937003 RepID=A0ABX4MCB2_9ACTO|nr:hypothetical protein [Actinomyces ruminis]PHP51699.1 hypothetical protein BW737_014580 [Actinomyces ruminis]